MRDDGRDTCKIRPNLVNPWSPAWSPEWSSIAFLSCCADHQSIDGAPLLEVQVLDGKAKSTGGTCMWRPTATVTVGLERHAARLTGTTRSSLTEPSMLRSPVHHPWTGLRP